MNEFYTLQDAAHDLDQAGLLLAVAVADRGHWRTVTPALACGHFRGAVLDSREAGADVLFVGLPGTRTDGRIFAPAALAAGAHALVGPGDADLVPVGSAPQRGTILVSGDPEAALTLLAKRWRQRHRTTVLGVTGSNGKTTTKDLLAALLSSAGPVLATRGNLNSAQGVPVTILGLGAEHRFAVVEMGASAVGHIAARAAIAQPRVGVITNAAAAHLEEFGSLEQVIRGKGELVTALPRDGTAVLNADSPGFDRWCAAAPCPVVSWGDGVGEHRWTWQPGDSLTPGWLDLDGERWPVPLPGRHNAANLCAAILAARAVGLADEQLRVGLAAFRPSPHRGAVRRLGGRLVLDDCYNANPASMLSAAGALLALAGGPAFLVLGGMAELGPDSDRLHRDCGRQLALLGPSTLIAVGDAAAPLAAGFGDAGGRVLTCPDQDAAASVLAGEVPADARLLVKGSRSTAMERVIEALIDDHDWTEDPAS